MCKISRRATPLHLFRKPLGSINLRHQSSTSNGIGLEFGQGPRRTIKNFSWQWLRDSCQCPRCVHPSTRQKLHKSSDFNAKIEPISKDRRLYELSATDLKVVWPSSDASSPPHESSYPLSWLHEHSTFSKTPGYRMLPSPKSWDKAKLSSSPGLWVPYSQLRSSQEIALSSLEHLLVYGILFISGVPNSETADATCELRRLAQVFGNLRHTFYGDTWDVKSVKESRNIAYTNLNLDFHADLLYFHDPPKYQMLHSLRNRVKGGLSAFVDGFHASHRLRESSPDMFATLTTTPVHFHYDNDGHYHYNCHPTIELEQDEVRQINYSPPFQAPLMPNTPVKFYDALRRFSDLLSDDSVIFKRKMSEGEAVIFDNRRVLHARTSYEEIQDETSTEASRWLKGCYVEGDAVWDRYRILNRRLNSDAGERVLEG
ncbi:Clavaminate synthase-like protein [Sistotremastrum niveocremeum HHB9708]|uniref:Clavaminate synthase-like protein n=1 Tax=Sistotremastrum niveocremeum HHB9708 TaxID=1314777 RepID=A0A164XB69_9AGAM|nr:Clavaminate synthase-like protein [Sistotremastrum niveocremeum HHB9708]